MISSPTNILLTSTILIFTIMTVTTTATEMSCQDNNTNDAGKTCNPSSRAPPQIIHKGSFTTLDPTSFQNMPSFTHDTLLDSETETDTDVSSTQPTIANIPGGESISLQYIQNIIHPNIASKLIESCNKRNGWTSSPQSVNGSAQVKATRTSRSCPLIWPQMYLPLLDNPSYGPKLEKVKDEIDLTWHLTQRIASLLQIKEEYIEPFQLVRYQPGEFYKEHHDHGSYYGVDTEQRPQTLLIFLSDLPSSPQVDHGGYTKFRALDNDVGVSVVPRMGDGVLWKNEDENGELLMDAIHEAVPPKDDSGNTIIKYAMNVWIAKKQIQENMDVSAYRTQ